MERKVGKKNRRSLRLSESTVSADAAFRFLLFTVLGWLLSVSELRFGAKLFCIAPAADALPFLPGILFGGFAVLLLSVGRIALFSAFYGRCENDISHF